MTPMISLARPLSVIVWPRTLAAPAYRRCQRPCEITTTASFPAVSFSAVNTRPTLGRTCMTSKKSAATDAPVSRSGSPAPVRLNDWPVNAAMCAYDRLWARQSR
jgi:hypothetical protein